MSFAGSLTRSPQPAARSTEFATSLRPAARSPRLEVIGVHGAPILVLGGISADEHVCRSADHPSPGWWEGIAGPGCALDTTRHRVIGVRFLDGGEGSDGRPLRQVTTHDQADAIAALVVPLLVPSDAAPPAAPTTPRLHAVIGASYGGMVALAFAERYPELLERLVVIGAAHRPHPMASARRLLQRRIVELGIETGRMHDALVLARALAMTTYRSDADFADRFAPGDVVGVEQYLRHHGERFARRFPVARFLALSRSSDTHTVDPARITTPTWLVAAENDAIVPRTQVEELAALLAGPSELVDLPGITGHDAFLTETDRLGAILRGVLETT